MNKTADIIENLQNEISNKELEILDNITLTDEEYWIIKKLIYLIGIKNYKLLKIKKTIEQLIKAKRQDNSFHSNPIYILEMNELLQLIGDLDETDKKK